MSMREKIARAIDPHTFKSWQLAYDYELRESGNAEKATEFADWGHSTKGAYEQADAVLETMLEPTPGMVDAGVSFALSVSIGGEYDWSQYVTDKHRNMIQAARNGK